MEETKVTAVRDIIANADRQLLFEALFRGEIVFPVPGDKTFITHISRWSTEEEKQIMQKFADLFFPEKYKIL